MKYLLTHAWPTSLSNLIRASAQHNRILSEYPQILSTRHPQVELRIDMDIMLHHPKKKRRDREVVKFTATKEWNEQRWLGWVDAWEERRMWIYAGMRPSAFDLELWISKQKLGIPDVDEGWEKYMYLMRLKGLMR